MEPGYCFNVYLDGEYRNIDINVEICEAVISKGKDGDRIVFKDILAVIVVSVLHRSAYEKIGAVYADAVSWVEQNGYEIIENNQKTTSMAYRIRKAWTIG